MVNVLRLCRFLERVAEDSHKGSTMKNGFGLWVSIGGLIRHV